MSKHIASKFNLGHLQLEHASFGDLYKECIESLKNNVAVLNIEETIKLNEYFKDVVADYLYTSGSRIDWAKVDKKASIVSIGLAVEAIEELLKKPIDPQVYIISSSWVPIIKTDLHTILSNFDDVTCLGFETWMFNPAQGYIIEYYYLGEMNVGLFPKKVRSLVDLLLELEEVTTNKYLHYHLELLEFKLHHLFKKIKSYDTLEEADVDFSLLLYIKNLLKKLKFQKQVDIGENLWNFAKDFQRVDDKVIRARVFTKIKENCYAFSDNVIQQW